MVLRIDALCCSLYYLLRKRRYKGIVHFVGKKAENGDTRIENISCDSDYMMDVIPRVGEASVLLRRASFHQE